MGSFPQRLRSSSIRPWGELYPILVPLANWAAEGCAPGPVLIGRAILVLHFALSYAIIRWWEVPAPSDSHRRDRGLDRPCLSAVQPPGWMLCCLQAVDRSHWLGWWAPEAVRAGSRRGGDTSRQTLRGRPSPTFSVLPCVARRARRLCCRSRWGPSTEERRSVAAMLFRAGSALSSNVQCPYLDAICLWSAVAKGHRECLSIEEPETRRKKR